MARFLLILSLLFSSLHAQEELVRQVYETKTNTWAQVTCLLGKLPAYGYAPVRVEMNNASKSDRTLTISFTSTDNSYGGSMGGQSDSKMTSSFSFVCKKGSRETVDFLVPLVTIFQSGSYGSSSSLSMNLSVSGYPSTSGSMTTEVSESWPSAVMSNTLYVPNASTLNGHLLSSHSSASYSSGDLEFAGDFDPKAMPTDWRAYIGQDTIIMTSDDWGKLDPGARTAILEWNRFGGKIIIYTTNASDDLATLQIEPNMAGKKIAARSFGHVQLVPLPSSNRLNAAATQRLVSHRGKSSYETPHASLLNDYAGSWPLHEKLAEKNFNSVFFILILLAFGVLVGPVNLFVFAKAGKRHKLFITTPIISLGCSALLIVIIMFQDGFGGRGHRILLMEIQPEENKAYIFQEQAARTGVLLGSSFETSEPTMITPVALAPSRWSRVVTNGQSPSTYAAEHGSDGLSVSGDWFQSRSIHGHLLKTVRPTRGRIELSPKAGAPTLTSTFDFDLDTIFYHASDGSWWMADAIEKGNSVSLSPTSEMEFNAWLKRIENSLGRHNASHLIRISKLPGRFFTTTEEATATETYGSIKWLSTTTIMTGPVIR